MSDTAVILFPTNAHVMRAEKLFQKAGFVCKLVPVPRHLSSDCGVCLSMGKGSIDSFRSFLDSKKLAYDGIVPLA